MFSTPPTPLFPRQPQPRPQPRPLPQPWPCRPRLRRLWRHSYGLTDLVALSVASTVGSGVFSLAGRVACQEAGPAVVLSLGIGALLCGLSATAYAELSSRVVAAGPGWGRLMKIELGWCFFLSLPSLTDFG